MSFPRYPKYKDSGVAWLGEVPEHWQLRRLKQACNVFPSNVDKKSHEGETPIVLCNYTDVYKNDVITAAIPFMAATASAEQIAKFTLRAGDTIVTKDSETADDIAVSAYVPNDLPGVVCGYHLAMVRPYAHTDGAFIKRLFDSTYIRSCVATLANGLTRVGLGQHDLDNLEGAFPPRNEQTAIAAFLDRETAKIDRLVAEQRRLIELLKEKRQAVISDAVTKGLNPDTPMKPSGTRWLGDVPEHWTVTPLKHVCRVETGHTPSKSSEAYWVPEECCIPWISLNDTKVLAAADFIEDTAVKISPLGMANSAAHLIEAGAVVMNRDGARVGLSAIIKYPMCVSQHVIAWVCGPSVSNYYLLHVLYAMNNEIYRIAGGATIPTIGMPEVKGMTMPLPPLKEQRAIVEYVLERRQRFDDLTVEANHAIDLLQERRTAIISAAVTGKIDVQGLSDGAAARGAFRSAATDGAANHLVRDAGHLVGAADYVAGDTDYLVGEADYLAVSSNHLVGDADQVVGDAD